MGTNFYLYEELKLCTYNMDGSQVKDYRGTHIGKRSAAGLYCWDCGVSLAQGGSESIHFSGTPTSEDHGYCIECHRPWDVRWFKECPLCGKTPKEEGFNESAAGRELGFNKKPFQRVGVASCSSFSWAIMPYEFHATATKIVDEYGTVYSHEEFVNALRDCPIQFFGSIGKDFF
jgi:hypothetical protein